MNAALQFENIILSRVEIHKRAQPHTVPIIYDVVKEMGLEQEFKKHGS